MMGMVENVTVIVMIIAPLMVMMLLMRGCHSHGAIRKKISNEFDGENERVTH